MADYRLTAQPDVVIRTSDWMEIPQAWSYEWQAYQDWLAAGNVPDPAAVPMPPVDWDWGPTFAQVMGV